MNKNAVSKPFFGVLNVLNGEVHISAAFRFTPCTGASGAIFDDWAIYQFIKWELTDSSGTYSGLMIVGEQKTPQGFQTMANMTIDLGEKEIPAAKVQELSRVVNAEFIQRAVISLDAGSSKVQ